MLKTFFQKKKKKMEIDAQLILAILIMDANTPQLLALLMEVATSTHVILK